MPDRAFVNRIRASGGPSHELLVLLDWHRVLTTVQAARATGAPERTVRYRLDQLHEAGLVEFARPGRETGSSPHHWWLRPAGARLVAGAALAQGRPTGMFAAHAASIAEVWLALVGTGPEAGIDVTSWLPDRAGWQEWESSRSWSRRSRLTPDAVAALTVDGLPTTVLIEVDLATMTQTLLREKVARYLGYSADRAWEGVHPHCPALLLLTTTATRAATFARAARSLVERYAADHDMNEAHAAPLVASCGLVRDPAASVIEPRWTTSQLEVGDFTLHELLSERAEAAVAAADWHARHDAEIKRRSDLGALGEVWRMLTLGDWLGSDVAAEAIRVLIGSGPAGLLDSEPDLARRIIGWCHAQRRMNRFEARAAAEDLVAEMTVRHGLLLADQRRRVLASEAHLQAAEPRFRQLVAHLAEGHLAETEAIGLLDRPPSTTFDAVQAELLAGHHQRRTDQIEGTWHGLGRKQRKLVTRELLGERYDAANLSICRTCGLVVSDHDRSNLVPSCPGCDGEFIPWSDRASHESYEQRVQRLRMQLAKTT